MTYFIKRFGDWMLTDQTQFDIREKLDPINYTLQFNSFAKEYYLSETEEFYIPNKIYGSLFKNTERIFNTFKDRPKSTGVLLHGEKGSGKTLLSQHICRYGNSIGMPVVIINEPFLSDAFGNRIEHFIKFLQLINQSCILLFDEFEKTFDAEAQENILLTLDGTKFTKMLFLFVANERGRINEYMFNRPGRIYYKFEFTGLQPDFIKEYCEDVLVDKSIVKQVINISSVFKNLNFDMLKAMVEEINRYGESPAEAIKFLNIEFYVDERRYEVYLVNGSEEIKLDTIWFYPFENNRSISLNKVKNNPSLLSDKLEVEEHDDEGNRGNITLSPDKLIKVNAMEGQYIYNIDGIIIKLVEQKVKLFNIDAI